MSFGNPGNNGTKNEDYQLKVRHRLTLPEYSSERKVQVSGSIIYDDIATVSPTLFYSDGEQWLPVGGSSPIVEVLPPPGTYPPGTVIYNITNNKLYYYDGTSWIEIDSAAGEDWAGSLLAGNTSVGGGTNNPTISAGDSIVYPSLGLLTENAGNLVLQSDPGIGGGSAGITDSTSTASVLVRESDKQVSIISPEAANDAIYLKADNGGMSLQADFGPITSFSQTATLTSASAASDSIRLNALAGGISFSAGIGTIASSAQNFDVTTVSGDADSVNIQASNGGILLQAEDVVDVQVTNGDISLQAVNGTITSSAQEFDVVATSADVDAVNIQSTAGGVFVTSPNGLTDVTADTILLNGTKAQAVDTIRIISQGYIALEANNALVPGRITATAQRMNIQINDNNDDSMTVNTDGGIDITAVSNIDLVSTTLDISLTSERRTDISSRFFNYTSTATGVGLGGFRADVSAITDPVSFIGDDKESDFQFVNMRSLITSGPAPSATASGGTSVSVANGSSTHSGKINLGDTAVIGFTFVNVTFDTPVNGSTGTYPVVTSSIGATFGLGAVNNSGFEIVVVAPHGALEFYYHVFNGLP